MSCTHCGLETDLSEANTFPGMTAAPVVRDLSGETVGDYEVLELVGLGGMGVVYKARDLRVDRTVAIKVLFYDAVDREEFVARFKREAAALLKLDHPHIVKILATGHEAGMHYIVTEFVEGRNLAQYLRSRDLGSTEIGLIMSQVCQAIDYAHSQGIIHRDIKPANIVVSGDGVKVLDFGLAQLSRDDSRFSTLTRSDLAMGTLNYLSPEQRTNPRAVDERSDVFSLGVVLYEMLTGVLPLGRFDPPSRARKGISRKWDAVVGRSLSLDPGQRYQSVSLFKKEIKAAVRTGWSVPGKAAAGAAGVALAAMILFFAWPYASAVWAPPGNVKTVKAQNDVPPSPKKIEPGPADNQAVTSRPGNENDVPTPEIKNPAIQPVAAKAPEEPVKKPAVKSARAVTKKSMKLDTPAEEKKKPAVIVPNANKAIAPPSAPTHTVYKSPSLGSPVLESRVATKNYKILKKLPATKTGPGWYFIRTGTGLLGWIQAPVKKQAKSSTK